MQISDFVNSNPWPKELHSVFGKIIQNITKPSKFVENEKPGPDYTIVVFTIEDESGSIRATTFNPESDLISIPSGTEITLSNIVPGEWNNEKIIKKCKVTIGHTELQPLEPQQIIDSAQIRLKAMELATQLVTCPAFVNQQINFTQVLFIATILSNYAVNQVIPEVVARRIAIFKEAMDIMTTLKLEPEEWQRTVNTLTNDSLEKANSCLLVLKVKLEDSKNDN